MRPVRDRHLNCDKLAELLLGPDASVRVTPHYSGYNGDTEAMHQDWLAWRDRIKSFWESGKTTTTKTLAEHGIDVDCPPWLFIGGNGPCWAEREFDANNT